MNFIKNNKSAKWITTKLSLDRKVLTGLVAKAISMLAGPIGAFITVWTLSVENQGLYYVFGSLLALRAFFELGAGTSVIQLSAHARILGDNSSETKLNPSFIAAVNQWMNRVSLLYAILAGLGGLLFLYTKYNNDYFTLSAWIAFIVVSALQFSSEGRWGMLQGVDKVSEANILRIKNNFIQYFIQWALLLIGFGLFSFCIASLIAYFSQEYRFRKTYKWLYASDKNQLVSEINKYKVEMISLIKRASQTYIAGYFVLQVQQPICFYFLGASSSAKLGFTQAVGSSLIGISSIWLASNFPKLSHLVADSDVTQARQLFSSRLKILILVAILGAIVSFFCIITLKNMPRFSDRLLSNQDSIILLLSMTIQAVAMGFIYWPRAFKVEPFVPVAYTQMIATPLLYLILVKQFGLTGAVLASISTWVIGFTGIALISYNYWKNADDYITTSKKSSPVA